MSDTPRTDAAVEFITKQLREEPSICADHPYYVLDMMKHEGMKVERELAAAKVEVETYRDSCAAKADRLDRLSEQVVKLRALIRLDDVEWRDKHIHPCGGESFQNWLVHVYLPVPLSENDKSPEAALERALAKEKS
jgi:hypothetical protein